MTLTLFLLIVLNVASSALGYFVRAEIGSLRQDLGGMKIKPRQWPDDE